MSQQPQLFLIFLNLTPFMAVGQFTQQPSWKQNLKAKVIQV